MPAVSPIIQQVQINYTDGGAAKAVDDLKQIDGEAKNLNSSSSMGGLSKTFDSIESPLSRLGFDALAKNMGIAGRGTSQVGEIMDGLIGTTLPGLSIAIATVGAAWELFGGESKKAKDKLIEFGELAGKPITEQFDTLTKAEKTLTDGMDKVGKGSAHYKDLAHALQFVKQSADPAKEALNGLNSAVATGNELERELETKTGAEYNEYMRVRGYTFQEATLQIQRQLQESQDAIANAALQYASVLDPVANHWKAFSKELNQDLGQEGGLLTKGISSFQEYFQNIKDKAPLAAEGFQIAKHASLDYFMSILSDTEDMQTRLEDLNLGDKVAKDLKDGFDKAGGEALINFGTISDMLPSNISKLTDIYKQEGQRIVEVMNNNYHDIDALQTHSQTHSLNVQEKAELDALSSANAFFEKRYQALVKADTQLRQEQERNDREMENKQGDMFGLILNDTTVWAKSMASVLAQSSTQMESIWENTTTTGEEKWREYGVTVLKDVGEALAKQAQAQALADIAMGNFGGAAIAFAESAAISILTGSAVAAAGGTSAPNGGSSTSANTSLGASSNNPNQYSLYVNIQGGYLDQGAAINVANALNTLVQTNGGTLAASHIYNGSNAQAIP